MIIKKTQKKIKHTLASTGLELNLQLGGARRILKHSSRLGIHQHVNREKRNDFKKEMNLKFCPRSHKHTS